MFSTLSIHEYNAPIFQSETLVCYKGPINNIIVADISHDIRNKLAHNPKTGRKVFSTFIELAQNILYYSSEKVQYADNEDSVGSIVVVNEPHCFRFSSGNLMEAIHVKELDDSCHYINSLPREELRKYKREQRNMPPKERSKGAGIGLIQVALSATSPLEISFTPVSDLFTYFNISVAINKA